ncbi:MAG TPA: hypothetical protein VIR54_14400, partial [Vicinamibacterales bacterium]
MTNGRRGRTWHGATKADLSEVGAFARGDRDGIARLVTHSLARCGALHDDLRWSRTDDMDGGGWAIACADAGECGDDGTL